MTTTKTRYVEVTWGALVALIDANPRYDAYLGADSALLRLPDATYFAVRSLR